MKKNEINNIINDFTKNTKLGGNIYNIYFSNIIFIIAYIVETIICWNYNNEILIKIISNIYNSNYYFYMQNYFTNFNEPKYAK